jgi:hypothetical protein
VGGRGTSLGRNHGAHIWAWASVRNKGCFVFVQLLILSMGCDRLWLLIHGYNPDLLGHWIVFGAARTLIGAFVAVTAWANMRSFQQLRDGDGE